MEKYSDLPTPCLSVFAAFMTPMVYLFIFDLKSIMATCVRHNAKEGRVLKDFRASCRRFFGAVDASLEKDFQRMADVWLAFTATRITDSKDGVIGEVPDDMLDALIEEALVIHKQMVKRLTLLHVESSDMPETAKRVFLASGDITDVRLPFHLRGAAAAAEKANSYSITNANGKRTRSPSRGAAAGGAASTDSALTFFCKACKKDFPKTDTGHRESPGHIAAAKLRRGVV